MGDTTTKLWPITAGAKEQRAFDVLNPSDVGVDITGWTVDAKIRSRPAGLVVHTFPTDMITVNSSGHVVLTVPAPISKAWTWANGWYRIVVTPPSSPVENPDSSRVLQGPVVVSPD